MIECSKRGLSVKSIPAESRLLALVGAGEDARHRVQHEPRRLEPLPRHVRPQLGVPELEVGPAPGLVVGQEGLEKIKRCSCHSLDPAEDIAASD